MVGSSFELTLENAKRFLGNIERDYDYRTQEGTPTATVEIEKAIKRICGGKKLKRVKDIPNTGKETLRNSIKTETASGSIVPIYELFQDVVQ